MRSRLRLYTPTAGMLRELERGEAGLPSEEPLARFACRARGLMDISGAHTPAGEAALIRHQNRRSA